MLARRIFSVAILATVSAVTLAVAAEPAGAADTTATFSLTGGDLTLSAPVTADLGSAATGDVTISGALGPITVQDLRGAVTSDWTSTVVSTDFATGGGTPAETVANTNVAYTSGPATSTTGNGTFTPGVTGDVIDTPATAFAHSTGSGNNTATWNPTLFVALPPSAVAGTYSGTITHSVT
jgi:hypothetical protein